MCCGVDQDGAQAYSSSPGQLTEPVTEGPGYGTRAVGMGSWAVDDFGGGWDPVRPDKWDWRDGDLLRSLGPESPVVGCRIRSAEALASTKEDRGADDKIMRHARRGALLVLDVFFSFSFLFSRQMLKWVCLISCSWMPGSLGGQLFGEFPGALLPPMILIASRKPGRAALMALLAFLSCSPIAATGRASGTVMAGQRQGTD